MRHQFFLVLMIIFCIFSSAEAETCKIVGVVSVEALKSGAFMKCIITGNPVACSIAAALKTVAGSGLAQKGITSGCEWSVKIYKKHGEKHVKKYVSFTIETAKKNYHTINKTYNAFNTYPGIFWIYNRMHR